MKAMSPQVQDRAEWAEFGARLKQFRTLRKLSVDETGLLLGISGNYIYMMERGRLAPADAVRERFEAVQLATDIYSVSRSVGGRERMIPVVSWAQAGRPIAVEELPEDWRDWIPSDCPDLQAYGVRLKGDSMEPEYHEGEIVVVMPNLPPKHGCLALVNLVDEGGYMFKRFTVRRDRPHRFRLSSFNRAYPPREMTWDQVHWVYPVYAKQREGCAKTRCARLRPSSSAE